MGNASSESYMERVEETTKEACSLFLKKFTVAYRDALFVRAKLDYGIAPSATSELVSSPKHSYVLKRGKLYKRGGNIKNWKRRYFTALNESDNFKIIYSKDANMTNKKGFISCCGYHIQPFTVEEELAYGPYGIKLMPYENNKRCWWLRADSEEERMEWEAIFSNACRKSLPNRNFSTMIATAYDSAFLATRNCYGYYNRQAFLGSEVDMLYNLVDEILQREVLQDVFDDISPSKSKKSQIEDMKVVADKIVQTEVTKVWDDALKAIDEIEIFISVKSDEIALNEGMDDTPVTVEGERKPIIYSSSLFMSLLELEDNLEREVSEGLLSVLEPVMGDLIIHICKSFIEAVTVPVARSFAEVVEGFQSDMILRLCGERFTNVCLYCARTDTYGRRQSVDERVEQIVRAVQLIDEEILDAHRRVDGRFYDGPLQSSRATLWTMYTTDLNALTNKDGFSPENFNAFEIYTSILDVLSKLVHDALHSFSVEWKTMLEDRLSEDFLSPQRILSNVVTKMVADSNALLRKVLVDILMDITRPTIQEMVVTPCLEMLNEFESLIPPECAEAFSMDAFGERLIHGMVERVMSSLVSENITEFLTSTDT